VANRSAEFAPPFVVAVVGPPQVGKTTLIRSLVRRYTKRTLSTISGPVTVVAGKNRRLTLFECNNDINAMLDLGKVADLVRKGATSKTAADSAQSDGCSHASLLCAHSPHRAGPADGGWQLRL